VAPGVGPEFTQIRPYSDLPLTAQISEIFFVRISTLILVERYFQYEFIQTTHFINEETGTQEC
jgi:hypothetical protein